MCTIYVQVGAQIKNNILRFIINKNRIQLSDFTTNPVHAPCKLIFKLQLLIDINFFIKYTDHWTLPYICHLQ